MFAKKAGFGKNADDEGQDSGKNSTPFRFDFGKLPDVKSIVPVVAKPSSGLNFGGLRRKEPGTVFVAGATGQVGIRIAQTLLRQGFSVRAGVPDLAAAQELARLAAKYKVTFTILLVFVIVNHIMWMYVLHETICTTKFTLRPISVLEN